MFLHMGTSWQRACQAVTPNGSGAGWVYRADMYLVDMETAVRQDLNDIDAGSYRWPTSIIDRCIARALKEYSFVWPRLQGIVLPLTPGVRAYVQPAPSSLTIPAAPVLTALPAGGSLPAGTPYVKITALAGSTETAPS